ncbi:MAG: aminotransferase class I/II-fold pyridoxal phosphate-dependent enzyme [Chloroflexi bacterium]|nr:aminotransferase class I/II-fold pyridoxal phosphate-dependent enzyme [Chloroflexota bacterium]
MSKFVSERVQAIPPSGIRKFFDIAATMDDVISLGIGEPDFTSPQPVIEAGIEALRRGETHYTSNNGLIELRESVAQYVSSLYHIDYNPENEILVSVGVSEALYLVGGATLNPGDEVIIPEPCFVSYAPEVMLAGGVPVMIPTYFEEDFQVTAQDIEKAITNKTKAILLGYPNNPTGAVLTRQRLLEIAAVAEKHDLLVISDEIYDRLTYGIEHTNFATLPNMRERTVVLSGLSKSHAMTGWRIGFALAPPEIVAGMRKIHQYSIMSAPTVSQYAAIEALKQEDAVQEMRNEYDRRRKLLVGGLNELGLDCFEPRGAFYAFPRITVTGMDDNEFAEKLLMEEKVAVVPGSAFGKSGTGFVRACYATSYEELEEALERLRNFMERHG